jgi:hypothetical protein
VPTAFGRNNDRANGVIDRFRSPPMARSAVLAGRTTADPDPHRHRRTVHRADLFADAYGIRTATAKVAVLTAASGLPTWARMYETHRRS